MQVGEPIAILNTGAGKCFYLLYNEGGSVVCQAIDKETHEKKHPVFRKGSKKETVPNAILMKFEDENGKKSEVVMFNGSQKTYEAFVSDMIDNYKKHKSRGETICFECERDGYNYLIENDKYYYQHEINEDDTLRFKAEKKIKFLKGVRGCENFANRYERMLLDIANAYDEVIHNQCETEFNKIKIGLKVDPMDNVIKRSQKYLLDKNYDSASKIYVQLNEDYEKYKKIYDDIEKKLTGNKGNNDGLEDILCEENRKDFFSSIIEVLKKEKGEINTFFKTFKNPLTISRGDKHVTIDGNHKTIEIVQKYGRNTVTMVLDENLNIKEYKIKLGEWNYNLRNLHENIELTIDDTDIQIYDKQSGDFFHTDDNDKPIYNDVKDQNFKNYLQEIVVVDIDGKIDNQKTIENLLSKNIQMGTDNNLNTVGGQENAIN